MIKAIVCLASDGGMGLDNKLLFNLPKDLDYFKEQTLNSTVIMGRKTLDSLPFKNGLPERKNIVLSLTPRKSYISQGVVWVSGVQKVRQLYNNGMLHYKDLWIIGGASVYKQFENYIDEWHMTLVDGIVKADTYYQPDLTNFSLVHQECVSSDSVNAQVGVYKRNKGE